MSNLRLHYLPTSPFSKKVLYVMKYYGIEADLVQVNPFIPEQRAALRDLSQLGKLPVLETENSVVSESSLVVEALERLLGKHSFVPLDAQESALVRHWDRVLDTYLIAPVLEMLIDNFQGKAPAVDNRAKDKLYRIATIYSQLEQQLKTVAVEQRVLEGSGDVNGKPTLLGGEVTLADITALSILPLAHRVKPLSDYQYLSAYIEAHQQDPIWQAINAEADAFTPAFIESVASAA